YKSTDGGLHWKLTLSPANMTLADGTQVPAGSSIGSVTDLIMDPFNPNRLLVGLGNVGLVASSNFAGMWRTTNRGSTWDQIVGGDQGPIPIPNSNLPAGAGVGTVKIAMGSGRIGDEHTVY